MKLLGCLFFSCCLALIVWPIKTFSETQSGAIVFSDETIEARFGPFIKLKELDGVLYFVGEILTGDVEHLRRATRQHDIATVVLVSPGGIVREGLELANIFRDKGLTAYLPESYNCASACSFMFFGAAKRLADGALGVHQFNKNNPRAKEDESFAQALAGRILENLNDFGAPSFVAERMLATPPDKMYWMNAEELSQINNVEEERAIALRSLPTPILKSVEPSLTAKPIDEREVIRAVQNELNRLGCNVGVADGIPGRKTKAGLRALTNKLDIAYEESLLSDNSFLNGLKTLERRICPKPKPQPSAPNLAGNWTLKANCSWTSRSVTGWFTLTRKSGNTYSFYYKNNLGETGTGTFRQNGLNASMRVSWSGGQRTNNNIKVASDGRSLTGTASNNCWYNAWKR